MVKQTAKTTKASTVKAKNKINKAPIAPKAQKATPPKKAVPAKKAAAANNAAAASSGPVAADGPPYTTTINPDSCNCKSQVLRPPPGGCKHIKALKSAAPVASSSIAVNPISGLSGRGTVLDDFDIDLGYTDANKNSNKFYKMQVVEANDHSTYWLVQHWGRIGTGGQNQVKDFSTKAEALKAFHSKFKSKAGVKWEERGSAQSNAGGKYRTMTEMRVAQAGGRIADEKTLCFCLSWNDRVDLDIHCVMPNGYMCYFSNKNPAPYISLDVDKQAHHFGCQVENIFLEASKCPDGDYRYFVRYFSGHGNDVPFTFVVN